MDQINHLPALPGVYFFYDERDTLVYVGKSISIRSRVRQHFRGKDRKSLKIQASTKRIAFEVTGSELIALLYESDLIKKHQPLYNRSQRRTIYQYGLYTIDVEGYKGLRIEKIRQGNDEVTCFSSASEAKNALFRITEKYGLCQKINGLYKTTGSCFQYQLKACNGACISLEPASEYNARVEEFIRSSSIARFTRLFVVPGRNDKETGLVYIENGIYRGFGFCPVAVSPDDYLNYIEFRQDNRDVRRILIRYLILH